MQFCQQTAVFQAACQYADQQLREGGLKCFSRSAECSEDVLVVISDAVLEIIQGLDYDLSEDESRRWNTELFTLCWSRTLSCIPELSDVLTQAETRSVRKLPEWNVEFFFEIVNQHKWTSHFMKAAVSLEPACGLLIMDHFIDHIVKAGFQSWDFSTVLSIAEFWFLTSNPLLQPYSSTDRELQERTSHVSELVATVALNGIEFWTEEWNVLTLNDQARITVLFFGILLRTYKERYVAIDLECLQSPVSNCTDKTAALKEPSNKDLDDDDDDDSIKLCEDASIKLSLSASLIDRISALYRTGITDDVSSCFMDDSCQLLSFMPVTHVSCGAWQRKLLLRLHNELRSVYDCSIESDSSGMWYKCVTLSLSNFQQSEKVLSEYETELQAKSSTVESLFEKHVAILSKRNHNKMKVSLLWLMENCNHEIIEDSRWIENIEKFASQIITSHDSFLILLESLRISKERLSGQIHARLQEVVVDVYQGLSCEEQNSVLLVLYCTTHAGSSSCQSLFSLNSEHFNSDLRAVVNRLTNDTVDIQMLIKPVAVFLLQNHVETVERLVDFAVNNKDHIQALVKIIKMLPSILSMKNEDTDKGILYQQINFYLYNSHATDSQRKMAVTMCHSLLTHVFICEKFQIWVEEFLQMCLFPFMVPVQYTLWNSEEEDSKVFSQTLNLLAVIAKHMLSMKRDWCYLKSFQPLVLVIWLCQILDFSEFHWSDFGYSAGQKEFMRIRETSRLIVERLLKVMQTVDIPDTWLVWLYQKTQSLHWSLQNFILPLFAKSPFDAEVLLPESLPKILALPESVISTVPSSNDDIYELYQYATISEETLERTLKLLHTDVIKQDRHCAIKSICAFSQLLPKYSLAEWRRVVDMTLYLSRSGCFRTASAENSDHKVHEETWHLITESLLLFNQINSQEGDTFSLSWQTLTENYATTLKICLLEEEQESLMAQHDTCTYILGVVVRLLAVQPAADVRTLVILAADLISMLQSGSCSSSCSSNGTAAAASSCSCYKLVSQSLKELRQLELVDGDVLISKMNSCPSA